MFPERAEYCAGAGPGISASVESGPCLKELMKSDLANTNDRPKKKIAATASLPISPREKESQNGRSDADIAATAKNVIQWLTTVPPEDVKVTVHDGRLRLEGELDSWNQKSTLEEVLRRLPGLNGIDNLITLNARTQGSQK